MYINSNLFLVLYGGDYNPKLSPHTTYMEILQHACLGLKLHHCVNTNYSFSNLIRHRQPITQNFLLEWV